MFTSVLPIPMVFADFFVSFVNFLGGVQAYFSFAAIPVNIFIILLSLWKVPNCLVRTYVLQISIATLTAVTFSTVYFAIVYCDPQWLRPLNISLGHLPFIVDNFLSYLAVNVYYFQSTVTMALAYINYKRLFFFQNVSRKKSIYLPFSVGFGLSLAMALCQTFEMMQSKFQLSHAVGVALASVRAAVQILIVLVTVGFYVLTAIQSVSHAFQAQMGRIRQSRWNVYRSVLFYCFTPNLFFWLSIPDSVCSVGMSPTTSSVEGLSNFDLFCVHVYAVTQYMNPPRLFVISFTVLTAFEEYRRAVFELLRTPFSFCAGQGDKKSSSSTELTSEMSSSA
uniref:G protein-coupled receptor n=1 Tax=Steinernema glaseri TaxID=37863 RepID=A0A1I7YN27_9BILA